MDNKIVKNVMWGISAMVGFIVAERLYSTTVKAIEEREVIGINEPVEVDEDESE